MEYHTESIRQTNVWQQVDILAGCQKLLLSSAASYHGSAMYVVIIRYLRSYYKEQWTVVVAEEDLVNHGRKTARNGQASRCRHCCSSRMTEVDGQSSLQMHLSESYPQRRLSVTGEY